MYGMVFTYPQRPFIAFSVWDIVQTELKCCGVKNATDWYRTYIKNRNKSKKILPESCCSTRPLDNNLGACTYKDENHPPNSAGCLEALEKSIIRNEGIRLFKSA